MSSASVAPRARWAWRQTALFRVLGSFVSWFGFAFCFALLYLTAVTVTSLGGYCASGGPYVIEVECPDNVVAFAPLSIYGGLLAVVIAVVFAQGFGVPLIVWAWPVLFVGLGWSFFLSFINYGDITGIVIGVVFVLMGIAPLALALRAGWRSTIVGTVNLRGEPFDRTAERSGMWLPQPRADAGAQPTAGDYALAVGILIAAVGLALLAAQKVWFG